ncbi:MAG TPA: hypothetical protein VMT22_18415 [Terriglobales bacterium]|jgi:hypothetical protein|nr:hypothetical protein [Terriglobales bacterium]
MKQVKLALAVAVALSLYGSNVVLAQVSGVKGVKPGVISAVPLNKAGTFCHLKFPAIQPSTLSTNKPQLKSKDSGDIVDFYGACDHDPVGYDEVCRQRVQNARMKYCDEGGGD